MTGLLFGMAKSVFLPASDTVSDVLNIFLIFSKKSLDISPFVCYYV